MASSFDGNCVGTHSAFDLATSKVEPASHSEVKEIDNPDSEVP